MHESTKLLKINSKETKLKLSDGTRYRAIEKGGCDGCAFLKSGGAAGVVCGLRDIVVPRRCATSDRIDRTSIIWAHRKPKPPKPLDHPFTGVDK